MNITPDDKVFMLKTLYSLRTAIQRYDITIKKFIKIVSPVCLVRSKAEELVKDCTRYDLRRTTFKYLRDAVTMYTDPVDPSDEEPPVVLQYLHNIQSTLRGFELMWAEVSTTTTDDQLWVIVKNTKIKKVNSELDFFELDDILNDYHGNKFRMIRNESAQLLCDLIQDSIENIKEIEEQYLNDPLQFLY